MSESELKTARGGILYDPSRAGKPGEHLFTQQYWRERGGLEERAGGRNRVAFIRDGAHRWVWRHYHRGGMVARALGDRYLYTGRDRTRSYREFRLLEELVRLGLPVPAPVAAHYERTLVLYYTADLITEELPASITLADAITGRTLTADRWRAVGRTIAQFHRHGVEHADLNAHNILLGEDRQVRVLDFDRGRLRSPGDWPQSVLARLKRSLEKIRSLRSEVAFAEADWQALKDAHDRALAAADS